MERKEFSNSYRVETAESSENIRNPEYLESQLLRRTTDLKLEEEDKKFIKEAIVVLKSSHAKQTRDEGDPYIVHPLRVALDAIERS
ncbi:hypothetical protein MYX06_01365 [Patescibacteria group bacterium AH-259-L05]|nr:hypothetical protein [Patescibacteria group bacterium AH-259-L05]